jgi:hypothetical protein
MRKSQSTLSFKDQEKAFEQQVLGSGGLNSPTKPRTGNKQAQAAAAYVEEQQKLQALQAQQQAAQQGGKYEPRPTSQYTASHPTTQGYAAAKE